MAGVCRTRTSPEGIDAYTRSMLLDRALRAAFRNFWTLFLLVALVTVTAHLVYGFIFKDVLEARELHVYIRNLSAGRQVNDVSPKDLETAETARWALVGIEVFFFPLLVGSTRRILVRDEEDAVPTVPDALVHPRDRRARLGLRWGGAQLATALAGAVVAVATWYLVERAGLLIAEPLPDRFNFVSMELARGIALAAGAPFLLVGLVTAGRSAIRPSTT